jgi:hypothetical protein
MPSLFRVSRRSSPKTPPPFHPRQHRLALVGLIGLFLLPWSARADWLRDDTSLAWRSGDSILWRFSYDSANGKPFFNPLRVGGGPSLTNFRPEDHPWHYGLWFSWKYINHVNYWEEDRQSGKAGGATRWTPPAIETRADGSASLRLALSYVNPDGIAVLTEQRELRLSAPDSDGGYVLDWEAHFTAGADAVNLDRTPMPGEPNGQVNGGYAGLGIRMAGPPLAIEFLTTDGVVNGFTSDRSRPFASAVACNFSATDRPVGAIAILSDPKNAGEKAPWYLINSPVMRFACPAILAPRPRDIAPQGKFALRYRIVVRREAWAPEALRSAVAAWAAPR